MCAVHPFGEKNVNGRRRPPGAEADDDATLLAALRAAGPDSPLGREAAGELYARHHDAVMAQAYRITRDRHRAEDLTAEAFAKTLRALRGGRGPRESFVGYALIAMRTEAVRAVADAKRSFTVEPEEMAELPQLVESDHAARLSERDQLIRAFRDLPALWQRVLGLLEVEALSIEEAADQLDTNATALRALSYRAREGLRTAYLQQYVAVAAPECAEVAPLLAGYTREGLGKRFSRRVRDHLVTCEECGAQASSLAEINARLRGWLGPVLLGGAVGAGALAAGPVDPAAASPMPQGLWWKAGIAASVLLVVGGVGIVAATSGARPMAPVPGPGQPLVEEPVGPDVPSSRVPSAPPSPAPRPLTADSPAVTPLPADEAAVWRDDATPFWRVK